MFGTLLKSIMEWFKAVLASTEKQSAEHTGESAVGHI